ncbi:putative acylpyruvase FAHD1 mitochondrial [Bienertia sinuspersici]
MSKLIEIGTKIICVGRNYANHAKELGNPVPKEPVLFMKPTSSYLANGGTILIPPSMDHLHYEAELAVVIGKKARDVSESSAMDFIAGMRMEAEEGGESGFALAAFSDQMPWSKLSRSPPCYALGLDMTARELQASIKTAGLPWLLAKGQDTFTPISEMIPKSAVVDPHNLELWLKVNGDIKQKGSTQDMMFKIPFLVSHISSFVTLLEGDVILTGTPEGVGPVKPGEKITAGITGLIDVIFNVEKRSAPIRN